MHTIFSMKAASAFHFALAQVVITAVCITLVGCASPPTPHSTPQSEQVKESPTNSRQAQQTQTGLASYISERFQGKQTASGETLEQSQMVAAHPSYPMGTRVRVINLENEREVEVRIIDRGGAGKEAESSLIDLSRAAAEQLGMVKEGRVRVRTEVVGWGGEGRK